MARWLLEKEDGTEINFIDLLAWRPLLVADEAVDDSDKVLTVSANKEWKIRSVRVEIIATATAGTRQMELQIRDGAADILWSALGGTATQGVTLIEQYGYGDAADILIPEFFLPAGFDVHIFDNAAIDAAADDMVIQMLIEERDAP